MQGIKKGFQGINQGMIGCQLYFTKGLLGEVVR